MADPPSKHSQLAEIAASLLGHLAWQESEGARVLLRPASAKAGAATPAQAKPSPRPQPLQPQPPQQVERYDQSGPPPPKPQGRAKPPKDPIAPAATPAGVYEPKAVTLDELRREYLDCQRCQLCQGRTNLVFGVGNPLAELVFVGEGPGEEEDRQGVPFVGRSGELLTKMIEAMGYSRDEVYICNVVKCRPPGNRDPEAGEIAACEPFLKAQLRMIQPKAIVALGRVAAQTLLKESTPVSKLRGQWREYEGVPLMPTYHPAYLLRSPGEKKVVWSDLKKVMEKLGKAPPAKE